MPRPPGAQRRDGGLRQRRGQVDAEHVVPAVVIPAGARFRLAARIGAGFAASVVRVAPEEAVAGAQVVVDPQDPRRVGIEARVLSREEVVAGRIGLRVGRRHVIQNVERHRIHAAAGNDVAGERLRHPVDGVQRVVDREPGLGEVAVPLELRRRALARAHGNPGLQPFVRVEEEGPVALDRPADRRAGVVVEDLLLRNAAHDVLVEVGVQRGVAVDVVRGAVELVGAAANRHRDGATAGPAELGVVGAGRHAHFLHGVGRRHERQAAARSSFTARIGRAVEREAVAAGDAAVDRNAVHAAVVERPQLNALAVAGLADDAGDDVREREGIAAGAGKVLDQLLRDDLAARRSGGLEQRCFGDDADFLGQASDREPQVETKTVAGTDLDFTRRGVEAGQRERHLVAPVHHAASAGTRRTGWSRRSW